MSDAWQRLVLLGTARGEVPVPAPDPLLAAPFAALDWNDRENAVLTAAGLVAVARSAGAPLLRGATTPPPCEPETAREVPPRAADLLVPLLAGAHPACFREWLEAAAQRGLVVAPRHLPALLAHGTANRDLRRAIARVLGRRGIWLATTEGAPEWVVDRAPVATETWQTGKLYERVSWLQEAANRDPKAAADALVATWSEESGETREALLRVLAPRPHPSLEAWLEAGPLRDRRAAIRHLARVALVRIQGSAFVQRAIARATPLLTVEGKAKKRLVVTLPSAFDANWRADGIEERPPQGMGERAFWATQILGLVPLRHWLVHFRVDAATFFGWNRDADSAEVLAAALVAAETLVPTPEAAAELVKALLVAEQWPRAAGERTAFAVPWFASLPKPAARAAATALLALDPAGPLAAHLLGRGALPALDDPTAHLDATLAVVDQPYRVAPEAEALAACLPAGAVEPAKQRVGARPVLTAAAEAFLRTLELRSSVLAAFDAAPKP